MVEMYPAHGGDCFLITFEEIDYRILIDGGFKETYQSFLSDKFKSLEADGKGIDLLVVTHVDNDHILGIIEMFRELEKQKIKIEVREIWYNGYRHLYSGRKQHMSVAQERKVADEVGKLTSVLTDDCVKREIGYLQGETLAELLARSYEEVWNCSFGGKAVCCQSTGEAVEVKLKSPYLSAILLNPGSTELQELEFQWNIFRYKKYLPAQNGDSTKYEECFERFLAHSDSDATNQSSIACMFQYTNKVGRIYRLLFLGDASAERCLERLKDWETLRFDCLKLPHHGSKKNIKQETLSLLHADRLLFSTDGQRYKHPDWEVVSAAACAKDCNELVFNYDSCAALECLQKKYPDKVVIIGEQGYCRVKIF